MRTTIDIPTPLMKQAKIKAAKDGITLKELFIKGLKKEVIENKTLDSLPWKALHGSVKTINFNPEDSAFDEYYEPEQEFFFQVNDPIRTASS